MDDQEPVLRVVRGEPTPEELAALVAVVARRSPPAAPARRSAWAGAGRGGTALPADRGPHAWRVSGRPR